MIVHIPNEHFPFFIQPILRILFGENIDLDGIRVPWTDRHVFLNVSITPVGRSLICSKTLADRYLRPLIDQFNRFLTGDKTKAKTALVEIGHDEYIAIQVEGQGLDAGQRVLELTAPLAMAGISIFFVTSYFCDYVLVPIRARHIVTTTLQQRGFVFSQEVDAYVSQLSPSLQQSPLFDRPATASSSGSETALRPFPGSVPTTPPARDIPELQVRTFTKLTRNGIKPIVDSTLRLVSCAASRDFSRDDSEELKNDIIQVLLATDASQGTSHGTTESRISGLGIEDWGRTNANDSGASFLSITLSGEPVSIFMEERLLPRLGNTLLCSKGVEDILVPIIFDLRSLGWTATGIVGGVAGRLSQGSWSRVEGFELGEAASPSTVGMSRESLEISFLSSAKAGSVLVRADQLDEALRALEMGNDEVKSYS